MWPVPPTLHTPSFWLTLLSWKSPPPPRLAQPSSQGAWGPGGILRGGQALPRQVWEGRQRGHWAHREEPQAKVNMGPEGAPRFLPGWLQEQGWGVLRQREAEGGLFFLYPLHPDGPSPHPKTSAHVEAPLALAALSSHGPISSVSDEPPFPR